MNNYLLPTSIIIAAIIIALGLIHLGYDMRVAQMCNDIKMTIQLATAVDKEFNNSKLLELCSEYAF